MKKIFLILVIIFSFLNVATGSSGAQDQPYKWKSLTVAFPSTFDFLDNKSNYSVDFFLEAHKVVSPEYHYFGSFIKGDIMEELFPFQ